MGLIKTDKKLQTNILDLFISSFPHKDPVGLLDQHMGKRSKSRGRATSAAKGKKRMKKSREKKERRRRKEQKPSKQTEQDPDSEGEVKEEEQKQKNSPKTHKKKSKKKERSQPKESEAKIEDGKQTGKQAKPKKRKKQSKSSPKASPSPSVKSQYSEVIEEGNLSERQASPSVHRGWTSKENRRGGFRRRNELIEVDSVKIEEDFDWSTYNSTHNLRANTAKKEFVSLEDSDRIIDIFSMDAGDYRGMGREMPHLGQRKIRRHLGLLFQNSLEAITAQTLRSGRKIKDWQPQQKRQILRELHRIRSSNRLLSQQNVQLREAFHKLMRSHNHPEVEVTGSEINLLYRRIEAFVRGYNHFSLFRKQHVAYEQKAVSPLVEGARQPLSEGGYIMHSRVKRDFKKIGGQLDSQRLVLTWREEEERELCELYLNNVTNFEYMIQNLRTKFGESARWNDFEILGRKIDHLIKLGLDKLQRLTQPNANSQKGNTQHREREIQKSTTGKSTEEKNEQPVSKMMEESSVDERASPACLEELSKVVYSNRGALRNREGGVIRQPSLLLRLIFANPQSYKVKKMLAGLLLEKHPPESYLAETIAVIKQFTDLAAIEEEKSHVRLVPRAAPILDGLSWADPSVKQDSLLGVSELKKEEWVDVEQWRQRPGYREEEALSILSSSQSDYEGFISK